MVDVTFIGAANAQFDQSFPVNGGLVSISMFIYISLFHATTTDLDSQPLEYFPH